jgi:type II secretory pathway pseudopilin PulG
MNTVSSRHGFSLVEALVAIGLLLLVVASPMQILRQASNSTQFASQQMTAYFLAQEGLELVHSRRDDLLLEHFRRQFASLPSNNPMSLVLSAPLDICSNCGLHIENDGSLVSRDCNVAGACRLYVSNSPGNRARYTHIATGGTITPFTRRITIEQISSGGRIVEFQVTSVVEWRTGALLGGQRVELTTYLQNIYDTN